MDWLSLNMVGGRAASWLEDKSKSFRFVSFLNAFSSRMLNRFLLRFSVTSADAWISSEPSNVPMKFPDKVQTCNVGLASVMQPEVRHRHEMVHGHVDPLELGQVAQDSRRKRPQVVVGQIELLHRHEVVEAVRVHLHDHGGPLGVVALHLEAFEVAEAREGSCREVSYLAELDVKLLQKWQVSKVFRF